MCSPCTSTFSMTLIINIHDTANLQLVIRTMNAPNILTPDITLFENGLHSMKSRSHICLLTKC